MGNFYVNHTVRAPQNQIAAFLERIERTAFVSPTIDGFTVVCDQQCDDQEPSEIVELGRRLSQSCECPAMAVLNHDDDALCYWVFDRGELLEEYDSEKSQGDRRSFSLPGFLKIFTGEDEPHIDNEEFPSGGENGQAGEELCRAFGRRDVLPQVQRILATKRRFAVETHQELVRALGLPECAVAAGYEYVAEGDADLDSEECLHTGESWGPEPDFDED
jgi:hypothetical protein